jgi:hypothetical protein
LLGTPDYSHTTFTQRFDDLVSFDIGISIHLLGTKTRSSHGKRRKALVVLRWSQHGFFYFLPGWGRLSREHANF